MIEKYIFSLKKDFKSQNLSIIDLILYIMQQKYFICQKKS